MLRDKGTVGSIAPQGYRVNVHEITSRFCIFGHYNLEWRKFKRRVTCPYDWYDKPDFSSTHANVYSHCEFVVSQCHFLQQSGILTMSLWRFASDLPDNHRTSANGEVQGCATPNVVAFKVLHDSVAFGGAHALDGYANGSPMSRHYPGDIPSLVASTWVHV